MSLITTAVKFTVLPADGVPVAGLRVRCELTRPDVDGGVLVPQPRARGDTDANGQCTIHLWPNSRGVNASQYRVKVYQGTELIHSFLITVPEQAGVVLAETIINQAPYPAVDAAQAAVTAAQAAAAEAANASRLVIGTVTTLTPGTLATASITGDAGAQVLNLGIPKGADGEGGPGGGAVTSVAGRTGDVTLTKTDVGLGNVNNTADSDKPVSTAQAAADTAVLNAAAADATAKANAAAAASTPAAHASNTSNPHNVTAAQVGADPAGTASSALSAHTGAADPHGQYVLESTVGAAGGVASLDVGGQIPAAQIPSIAITEYLGSVASQAAMLALSGQNGDWCIRTDTGTNWVITGANPALLAGWTEMVYPVAPVSSVAGRTGAVTLTSSDLTDSTSLGRSLLAAVDAAAARAAIGAGTSSFSGAYADLSGKPTLFDGAYASLSGKPTLGTAAALDYGTSAGNLVRLDASTAKLPAVDGSLLTNLPAGSIAPLRLTDANTVEQYNGTTAQKLHVYNSRNDPSNWERGFARFVSNVFEIGTEKLGTGSNRDVRLVSSTGRVLVGNGSIDFSGESVKFLPYAGNTSAYFTQANNNAVVHGLDTVSLSVGGVPAFEAKATGAYIGIRGSYSAQTFAGWDHNSFDNGAAGSLTVRPGSATTKASPTYIVGADLLLYGGDAATQASGAAHGGTVRLAGGRAYGSGKKGIAAIRAHNEAPEDTRLSNSDIVFYLDQSGNNLKVRVKYSDGTLKLGTLALA